MFLEAWRVPWFKVDDGFHSHPKIIDATSTVRGREAIGLWAVAGSWCADNLTDGTITIAVVKRLGWSPRHAAELLAMGLWEQVDDETYAFHQWTGYQPTRVEVEEKRKKTRVRVQNHRAKHPGGNSASNAVTETIDGPRARDNPSRPDPTDPNNTSGTDSLTGEDAAAIFLETTGSDDLSPLSTSWNHKEQQGVIKVRDWANRQDYPRAALIAAFETGKLPENNWLLASPIHVWADRLGALTSAAKKPEPDETGGWEDDPLNRDHFANRPPTEPTE